MKTIVKIIVLSLTLCVIAGQGTLQFEAFLTGANAIPPTTVPQTATASLSLHSNNDISTQVLVPFPILQMSVVKIFQTVNSAEIGTFRYSLNPGGVIEPGPDGEPGGRLHSLMRSITDAERVELIGGQWWMSVHDTSDAMIIRGQLTVVPEPGTIALLAVGLGVLLISFRTRQ